RPLQVEDFPVLFQVVVPDCHIQLVELREEEVQLRARQMEVRRGEDVSKQASVSLPRTLGSRLFGQLLHGRLTLLGRHLRPLQHFAQLLQVVQCAGQLTAHCLQLALQELCTLQGVAAVHLAAVQLLLQ
ncbi:hypothetical protein JZ751_014292, partial [Albula glossodonta]